MNPYLDYVRQIARLRETASALPLGGFPTPSQNARPAVAKALIFSPHPDDECVVGGLPLRLLRQADWRIVNVAVTQGSNPARRAARWEELQAACRFLQFDLEATRPGGLERINPAARREDSAAWRKAVAVIRQILAAHRPDAVFFPHDRDWNSTHLGVNALVMDALREQSSDFACQVIETEFWGQLDDPNLMIELSVADVADLVAATSFHAGEVRRNPYHLVLPAWFQDNVRRGGELVGGQGKGPPPYLFATLYRARLWSEGKLQTLFDGGRQIAVSDNPTLAG